ncbi:hypothetical protein VSS74_16360 [Conexibacter stalactiti]|uniref:Uncharacterized protein n=1 Tax=Conexibacter stalactiti TaxID=1940611 RepID=A0ABU4HRI6_9ACTN|nr:hypothetical protein [Conexibacter stalactiti]MDW5595923.1 hypothetical protein [Conexibacter stalactiti]MEC5036565.1 hypothetical protein [Conexibacter stalactiti]
MQRRRTSTTVALTSAAIAVSGCGINDPLNDPTAEQSALTVTTTPNEIVIRRNGQQPAAVADLSPTATAAVRRFAALYVNWDYRTLTSIQRRLAAMAVGQASAMNARAAARTPGDYELRRGRVTNRGHVVGLSTLPTPAGTRERAGASERTYVLVTVEETTGSRMYDGLRPSYHVTLATVQRLAGGWAVSRWEPQS